MTAKEFLESKEPNSFIVPEEWLIEFAQFHVQNALEAASDVDLAWYPNYMDETGEGFYSRDIQGILNSYPLENIK